MGQFKLATSFMRKRLGGTIILVLIFLISALLINLCLVSFMGMYSLLDNKKTETNEADYAVGLKEDAVFNIDDFKNLGYVKEVENETMKAVTGKIKTKEDKVATSILFADLNATRKIAKPIIVEKEDNVSKDKAIYLPIGLKINYDYKLNDKFVISVGKEEKEFIIAGFYESVLFGSPMIGAFKAFVDESIFNSDMSSLNAFNLNMLALQMNESDDTLKFLEDLSNLVANGDIVLELNYMSIKFGVTTMSSILVMVLMVFGILIFLIAMLVVRFQIKNFIKEDIKDIGVLKANGYTGKELFNVLLLQYFMLSVVGILVGLILSYAFVPIIGGVIASGVGIAFTLEFNILFPIIVLVLVLGVTMGIVALISRNVKKVTPVIALRSGIETHSFKKNHFPLENGKGSLVGRLSLKSIFTNIKQNILLFVIIIILTFSAFTCIMFYDNMVTRKDAMYNIAGMETCDMEVNTAMNYEERAEVRKLLEENDKVEKVIPFTMCLTNDYTVYAIDEADKLNVQPLIKGRWAKYENEIVVSPILKLEIGDTYTMKVDGKEIDYIVTGLCQSVNNVGKVMYMTIAGQERTGVLASAGLYIYLKDYENDFDEVADLLYKNYGDKIIGVSDVPTLLKNILGSLESAIVVTTVFVLIIMAVVTVLMLYLLINTLIKKEKKNLGVYKALGYTSNQITWLMMLTFLPIVVIASLIGVIGSYFLTNPITILMLSAMGVGKAGFTISPLAMLIFALAFNLLAFLISYLVSLKVKKISPYNLIVE